jgi:hypothetical protein
MAFISPMATMRVVSFVRFRACRKPQARSNPRSFAHDAKSLVGFMTAFSNEDLNNSHCRSESHLALLKDIELKIDELKWLEKRLGTSDETPPDLERARELAHRINNLLTTYRLGGELSAGGGNF